MSRLVFSSSLRNDARAQYRSGARKKMAPGKDISELKHEQTFQLPWKGDVCIYDSICPCSEPPN